MTDPHPEFGVELRLLAQAVLDRLDPVLRAAAARASAGEPGRCQQVWCPVCALAAMVNGEHHPLLAVIGEHSLALLAVMRAIAGASAGPGGPPEPPSPGSPQGPPQPDPNPPPGRYQHIPITFDE